MFITENRDKYEVEHQVAAEDATSEEFEAFLHSIYPCGKEPTGGCLSCVCRTIIWVSEEFLVPVAILADYYGVKPVLSACILLIVDHAGIPKVEKLRVAIKTNAAELEVGLNIRHPNRGRTMPIPGSYLSISQRRQRLHHLAGGGVGF